MTPASPLRQELERAVLARVKFDNPAEFRERMDRSERAVCRINLPKPEWGTGFLVGLDTVLTNYHVVEDLDIGIQARDQVAIQFDYVLGADGRPPASTTTCKLAADRWLLAASRVDDLDFALLRLDRPVGEEPAPARPAEPRGWLKPSAYTFSGQDPEPLFILQHPQIEAGRETHPLKITVGFVTGQPTDRRVTYTTNTLKGSSGSPCFRADWDLVALHRSSTEGAANEGIPFKAILDDLERRHPPVRLGERASENRASGRCQLSGPSRTIGTAAMGSKLLGSVVGQDTAEPREPRANPRRVDLSDVKAASSFQGRREELAELSKWIVDDKCRLIAVIGIGGIGKTSLAVQVAKQVQYDFDYVLAKSLESAPRLDEILTDIIRFVSGQRQIGMPADLNDQIRLLLDWLGQNRCLVVLDNAERILRERDQAGQYRPGYEPYGQLFEWIGRAAHSSCLILTSREEPNEIAQMKGHGRPVRSRAIDGLKREDAAAILREKGIVGSRREIAEVIRRYQGHPLWLELIPSDIRVCGITQFLEKGAVPKSVQDTIAEQLDRLSELEKQIMNWLAINSSFAY